MKKKKSRSLLGRFISLLFRLFILAGLGIFLALIDVPKVIEPVQQLASKHQSPSVVPLKFYQNSYSWRDYDQRQHRIYVAIRGKDLMDSINEFGYRKTDLDYMHSKAKQRYFHKNGFLYDPQKRFIEIDYKKIWRNNSPRLAGVAGLLTHEASLRRYDRRQYLGLVLSLVQSMKYTIPPKKPKGRHTLGFYTPPEVAVYKKGDCDSKTLFFATIWKSKKPKDLILVEVPGHLFLGVRGLHASSKRQTVVKVGGIDYLLCETTAKGWKPGDIDEKNRRHIRKGRVKYLQL
jgi:hypothetical protein